MGIEIDKKDVKENQTMKVMKMLETKISSGYEALEKLDITDEKYGTTIANLTSSIMLYGQLIDAITRRAQKNEEK